jgi:hypothetical protein
MSLEDTIGSINQMISKYSGTMSCGSECQQKKEEQKLQLEYENAQRNVKTAPEQLSLAAKNYYMFEGGEAGYNEYVKRTYEKESVVIESFLQDYFNELIEEDTEKNKVYNTLYKNIKHVYNLFLTLHQENRDTRKQIDDEKKSINTNDRSSYYESESLEKLETWKQRLLKVYYILAIIVSILILLYTDRDYPFNYFRFTLLQKILVIIGFFLYPTVFPPFIKLHIVVYHWIINHIPKNVYF